MDFPEPKLLVLSAPSGAGKSSIFQKIQPFFPDKLRHSVSYTTRQPRVGEEDKLHYFFVTKEEFRERIAQGDFIEWAEVHGHYYGTSRSQINSYLKQKQSVILDIDVQGAMQLMKLKDLEAEYIFLSPPSLEELEKRLRGRETDSEEQIHIRLSAAMSEMDHKIHYPHQLVNADLESASLDFIILVLSLNGHASFSGELAICKEIIETPTLSSGEKLAELLPILQNLF